MFLVRETVRETTGGRGRAVLVLSNLSMGSHRCFNIITWNVRGLGEHDKCDLVKDTLIACTSTIICLQETKLSLTLPLKAKTFLPPGFTEFKCVDAAGSRGGMLTAWNGSVFSLRFFIACRHTLTFVLSCTLTDLIFAVTNVYAPSDHGNSIEFLDGLEELATHIHGHFVILGGFQPHP